MMIYGNYRTITETVSEMLSLIYTAALAREPWTIRPWTIRFCTIWPLKITTWIAGPEQHNPA